MAVKVLIQRKFKPGTQKEVAALLNEFRAGAMNRPGYISGETLFNVDDIQVMLVISTWNDLESWMAWRDHTTRITFERMLEPYQEGPTQYDVFAVGTTAVQS